MSGRHTRALSSEVAELFDELDKKKEAEEKKRERDEVEFALALVKHAMKDGEIKTANGKALTDAFTAACKELKDNDYVKFGSTRNVKTAGVRSTAH